MKKLVKHSIAAAVIVFIVLFYKCPFYYFFGVPCPGCGLTQAHLAALRLDFVSAFKCHPLFFIPVPVILYFAHKRVLKKRLSSKLETVLLCVISGLFVLVYVLKLQQSHLF